jgi:putative restriction endonuclease
MPINHRARATRSYPYLRRRANSGREPFTYGELAAKLGIHPRALRYTLGVIQRFCRNEGLPPLQSLVVNKKTRLPGSGFKGA